jgi:hypothetical protein
MSSVRVLNREPVNVGFSERDVSIVEFPATPGSGETIGRFPLFVQRVTLLPDVPENETTTDVFLPLA